MMGGVMCTRCGRPIRKGESHYGPGSIVEVICNDCDDPVAVRSMEAVREQRRLDAVERLNPPTP